MRVTAGDMVCDWHPANAHLLYAIGHDTRIASCGRPFPAYIRGDAQDREQEIAGQASQSERGAIGHVPSPSWMDDLGPLVLTPLTVFLTPSCFLNP